MLSVEESEAVLRSARRIAVLGIKPESRRDQAAHWVPEYLSKVGYEILPVPVYYPHVTEILGRPVFRTVREVPGTIDVLNVFRKPEHVAAHLADILEAHPNVVWFQSGCLHEETARHLEAAGIGVVHDCIACRRASMPPATEPFATGSGSR